MFINSVSQMQLSNVRQLKKHSMFKQFSAD